MKMNGVTLWLDGLNLIMKISNLIGIDFSHPPGDLSHRICEGHRRTTEFEMLIIKYAKPIYWNLWMPAEISFKNILESGFLIFLSIETWLK